MKLKKRRWVVKAGSQMVIEGGPLLIRDWMRQVRELKSKHGIEIVWVTSGAIATARLFLKEKSSRLSNSNTLQAKQALSAMGQPMVHGVYQLALEAHGTKGAQVLLTSDDLKNSTRRKNLVSTLTTLLSWDVVPVLNENDAVSTAEIQFGDNDALSSLVAQAIGAERLILLTDVDGLYTADPFLDPKAQKVVHLARVTAKVLKQTQSNRKARRKSFGKGGMYSKLKAAQSAQRFGIVTHLIRGDTPHALTSLLDSPQGTQIGGTVTDAKKRKTKRGAK